MLTRLCKRPRYYQISCNDCDLVVAIHRVESSVHPRKPLRPLYSLNACPFCQNQRLERQEMLTEDYQRIGQAWDMLDSGDVDANLAAAPTCNINDDIGEIDLSQL